jgi:hypothetical protein
MDTGRFLTGTVVGAIVLYTVGYVIWDVAFAAFFQSYAGSAINVWRDSKVYWAVAVGNLGYAALLTYVLSLSGAAGVGAGVRIGAIAAFLMWVAVDFLFYGMSNIFALHPVIVDPALEAVHGGVAGGAIAVVRKRGA